MSRGFVDGIDWSQLVVVVVEVPIDEQVLVGHFGSFWQFFNYFEHLDCSMQIFHFFFTEQFGSLNSSKIA